MSFQLKAPEWWTAADVQEHLESHMRGVWNTCVEHSYPNSTCSVFVSLQSDPCDGSFSPFQLWYVSGCLDGMPAKKKPPTSLPASALACNQPWSDNGMVSPHKPASLYLPPAAVPDPAPAAFDSPGPGPGVQQTKLCPCTMLS